MKRLRYEGGRAPRKIEHAANGAACDEPRRTTQEAAELLGVPRVTLFRWWRHDKLPRGPDGSEPCSPDVLVVGQQRQLLWPDSVISHIRSLIEISAHVAGRPGFRRLPTIEEAATR